jgi:hypothetical protein
MSSNGAGSFKAGGIVDSGFERERCDWANAWNGHHSQANAIATSCTFDPPVQGEIILVYRKAGI